LYGYKTSNFPESYSVKETGLNYSNDPDWSIKLETPRLNIKKMIFFLLLGYGILQWQIKRVEKFDNLKRVE
jgi:hypothetical protein